MNYKVALFNYKKGVTQTAASNATIKTSPFLFHLFFINIQLIKITRLKCPKILGRDWESCWVFFIRNNFFSNLIHLSNYQKVCKNYKEELLSVSWFLDVMLTVGHQIADTIYWGYIWNFYFYICNWLLFCFKLFYKFILNCFKWFLIWF